LNDGRTRESSVQIRISEEVGQQAKRFARLILGEPFQKRSWAELGYFLVSSALAGVTVAVLGAMTFSGLALTVAFVGVVILGGGLRAARLVISEGAVEKHVANIFSKLDLPATPTDHRRVLAVLRYLEE
jgi:hypothetical protein